MFPAVPDPYPAAPSVILNLVTLFNPWSIVVWIVWAEPVRETISVIHTPITLSLLNFSIVSLLTLFCTSLELTNPIRTGSAEQLAASGSETGLSLFGCG